MAEKSYIDQALMLLYSEPNQSGAHLDLRSYIESAKQVEAARRLAFRGLLTYQPFVFDGNFAVGSGLSIVAGHAHDTPSIYCPGAGQQDADVEFLAREVVAEERRAEFFAANEAMRRFYDDMIDQTTSALGSIEGMSVLDVGCNSGYFPLSLARRGARQAKGIDRVDYSPTIALLNELCGTRVEFGLWSYDGSLRASEQFDLVISTAVLVHLSDPLQHLAWLGSSARKALLVFTPCHRDDEYSIKFHSVNRYYRDKFPYCFDVSTISRKLLRLAMEQMGFTRIVEITAAQKWMPPGWAEVHLGLLGIREHEADSQPERALIT
jgi:SAM-dependent methyltransferase